MRFEFTEKETSLFSQLTELVKSLSQENGNRSPDEKASVLSELADKLSHTAYPDLGIRNNGEMVTLFRCMEILSSRFPSEFIGYEAGIRIFGRALSAWGNVSLLKEIWNDLRAGRRFGAVALSEPTFKTRDDTLLTIGTMDGEQIRINGCKELVINAPNADWIAVAGRLGEEGALFLVEKSAPGLTIHDHSSTLGYEGGILSGLTLDECRIGKDRILGPLDMVTMIDSVRQWENEVLIGAGLGLMQTAFEAARDYAKSLESGGKAIITYQSLGFKLSDMLTLWQTAQLLTYRAGWMLDSGDPEAAQLTLAAKLFTTEAAERVASEALKLTAGTGFVQPHPAELSYRCAKFGQIAGTANELAKLKIGDAVLGIRK